MGGLLSGSLGSNSTSDPPVSKRLTIDVCPAASGTLDPDQQQPAGHRRRITKVRREITGPPHRFHLESCALLPDDGLLQCAGCPPVLSLRSRRLWSWCYL